MFLVPSGRVFKWSLFSDVSPPSPIRQLISLPSYVNWTSYASK
jgi:hypothetical protein